MTQSLLEKQLKKKVASVFKGKLTRGIISRDTGATTNSAGDTVAGSPLTFTFEGIRESFSARYQMQAGIPTTDVSILILLGSVKPATTPQDDDKVYLKAPWNAWHQVRRTLEIDPAGATAKLQVYEIPAPT